MFDITKKAYSSETVVKIYSERIKLLPVEELLIKKYFKNKNSKVLDIGSGTGRTTYYLNKFLYDVIGIDISENMINYARNKYPKIEFELGDVCKLNFPNNKFDYILFSYNGIDCIYPESNRLKALREINRVLKKRGIFLFSTHNSLAFISRDIFFYKWILRFLRVNIKHKKKISHFMYDRLWREKLDVIYYFNNPVHVKHQLALNGFQLIDKSGVFFKSSFKNFEPWLYYVALKI